MNNFKINNVITTFLIISCAVLVLVQSSNSNIIEGRLRHNNISLEHSQLRTTFRALRIPQEDGLEHISYKLGQRQEGDRLVHQKAEALNYSEKQDVTVRLVYPETDTEGNIITYIEITCEQDNDVGNAYIADGAIGQRSITIILEAEQTTAFSYIAKIYAMNY